MPPHEDRNKPDVSLEAEKTYSDFRAVCAASAEGAVDLEALCKSRPDLATELKRLHAFFMSDPGSRPSSEDSSKRFDARFGKLMGRLQSRTNATGRYKILREMARGGMGAILRIHDRDLDRDVAMKVALIQGEDESGSASVPQEMARFLEEARITGQLEHPGIVPVYELGIEEDGQAYFTMRLVKGDDLKTIFQQVQNGEEGMTLPRALGLLLKACEALAYAHSKGVVHRDLKPANIMVGRFGEVYVMDWGLARVQGRDEDSDTTFTDEEIYSLSSLQSLRRDEAQQTPDSPLITMDGHVVGTPAYMSPEQARGDIDELGSRSDVYSMGAILYHLLSGSMPYVPPETPMTARTILAAVTAGPPPPLRSLSASVPPELEAICDKAMMRDAALRYPDMMALAEDLRAYLEGHVVQAYASGSLAELGKWVKRNRSLAMSIAAALAVAITGLAGIGVVESRGRVQAQEEQARTQKALDEVERQSYLANLTAAAMYNKAGDAMATDLHLERCPEDLRGWEWRHLDLMRRPSIATLTGHEAAVGDVQLSANGAQALTASRDGTARLFDTASGDCLTVLRGHEDRVIQACFFSENHAATASADGTARIWNLENGEEVSSHKHPRQVLSVAASPDGQSLATGCEDGSVRLFNQSTGAERLLLKAKPNALARQLRFSSDGKTLLAARWTEGVQVIDVPTGEAQLLNHGLPSPLHSLALSSDETRIAAGDDFGNVYLWDRETLARLKTFKGSVNSSVRSLAFLGSPRRLLVGTGDCELQLFDTETGKVVTELPGHLNCVSAIDVTDDSSVVASASWDGTAQIWDPSTQMGRQERPTPDTWDLKDVAITSDGKKLVTVSGDKLVRIWDSVTGTVISELEGHSGWVTAVEITPDDEIVTTSTDGTVAIWNLEDGTVRAVLRGHESRIWSLALSPDGSRIASGDQGGVVRLWDTATGDPVGVLRGIPSITWGVAFSPDGKMLASGGENEEVILWDTMTLKEIRRIPRPHVRTNTLVFAPDGRLAMGYTKGEILIVDPLKDEPGVLLEGHDEAILDLMFDDRGQRLFSASRDGTIRVWDASAAFLCATLRTENVVSDLARSSDGNRIVALSPRGLTFWDTEIDALRGLWSADKEDE